MNIKTDYESPLVLKNIIITEGHFKRNEDSLENLELKVGVSHDVERPSEREYKITLELNVADPEEKLSVFVKGMAIFETKQENQMLIEHTARYDPNCFTGNEHYDNACTKRKINI